MHTLVMIPATGESALRFVGDRFRFSLRRADGGPRPDGWRAFLRTNLGRADVLRAEIVRSHGSERPLPGAAWRDIPMDPVGAGWDLELVLAEVGYFQAKAYALDHRGFQVWPVGPDVGLTVHPADSRSGNTIYCAFPRLLGVAKSAVQLTDRRRETRLRKLDQLGFAVIPPSGKLRGLIQVLPHIVDTLGCRILQLLPVNPTPTTYARFGRIGSPYAGLDLTAIDPALIDFDRRTTGVDQFRELAYAVHARGARLFLDLVINHTGWSSTLQERHPEWFLRNPDGTFVNPGAWGTTWEDLVDLDESHRALWDEVAQAFLTWCERGVDGFRCDAGYKIPTVFWQYVIARVRQEFPDAVFFLEGLGGAWRDTANLLTEGGMQWAYSELFQEYSGLQVAGYLDHALKQSQQTGLLVHFSETHDNDRLARRGRVWSLLRNRLSALTSVCGGFGFTSGVEWLAPEKIDVHGLTGLAWGAADNLIREIGALNRLLSDHPCFFDGAKYTRLSHPESPVYALRRESADGLDVVLVLANTDVTTPQSILLPPDAWPDPTDLGDASLASAPGLVDLLGQAVPPARREGSGGWQVSLEPGACYCVVLRTRPTPLEGKHYRRAHARAAWLIRALAKVLPPEQIGPFDLETLSDRVDRDPHAALAALPHLDPQLARRDLVSALDTAIAQLRYPQVVSWNLADRRRVTPVPPGHWLLIQDSAPFRAQLEAGPPDLRWRAESIPVQDGHVACFAPWPAAGDARLHLERYTHPDPDVVALLRFLAPSPEPASGPAPPAAESLMLLTNGRGGMARLGVDLGSIRSKYDCLLGANLHASVPVDRHILAKRARAWVNANGFIWPLNRDNLRAFDPGPPASWEFDAQAGDGRLLRIRLTIGMIEGQNTVWLRFDRLRGEPADDGLELRVTTRVDLEDRNFHWETKRNPGAEDHFTTHTVLLEECPGFVFAPASDRQLRVYANTGAFHPEPEWCVDIPHPVETSRGQPDHGDAYSPGWFDLPLIVGESAEIILSAEPQIPGPDPVRVLSPQVIPEADPLEGAADPFRQQLERAARAFLVRRDDARSVIAGYPWFLDWGRDTLICARGLIAAGFLDEVRQILRAFGRFEHKGTLPNTIHGENATNRDTSDAPLWFGLVSEELARALTGSVERSHGVRSSPPGRLEETLFAMETDRSGRPLADVLRSIVIHYVQGTPNGLHVDPASGLVWSPSHFTWMDTDYPAGTPREGYPIEIQALWIRLLRLLARLGLPPTHASDLADCAQASVENLYWLEDKGYFADCLRAASGEPAETAPPDTALRSNFLFAISLGVVSGSRARRAVEAATRHLVVPGALRSLAPLPVSPPLPIYGKDGQLLNDPVNPYCGRYEGDEDTRRKPAYHNGTAWVWTLPSYCESLARAWDFDPGAVAAAKAHLAGLESLLNHGCLGHLPEILDGDGPHTQRGCDAQAWSVTEALRVWALLS